MNICFGRATEEVDELDSLFYSDGKHFWYRLVFEEDQIRIEDTCGRMLPISYEHCTDLSKALQFAVRYGEIQQEYQTRMDKLVDTLSSINYIK